jgi:beta-N-acetylhexosaminidase
MICHRVRMLDQARTTLETQPPALLEVALNRVADFKKKMHPATVFSRAEFDAINRDIWDLRVAVLGEERAHQRSTDAGSHSPVELY